jgi:hypothetical protein
MARGILRYNDDGVLGVDGCYLSKDIVTKFGIDLLVLLNCLLSVEPTYKEASIGSWSKFIV